MIETRSDDPTPATTGPNPSSDPAPESTGSDGTGPPLRLGLPKGRMHDGVRQLLADAGIRLETGPRDYRPKVSLEGFEVKILKPQNIIEMLAHGSRDLGFAGADWVRELGVDLVEILDTGMDPVRLVAAAPVDLLEDGKLPKQRLRVATEYPEMTAEWIDRAGIDAELVRSYGATEVFPPEDADCIIDNTATGATLRANQLRIVDELMRSSTRLYASPEAAADPVRRAAIDRFAMLVRSVLEARGRAMIEVNVSQDDLDRVVEVLPSMRRATISRLHHSEGYAVKAAVPRDSLPEIIPELKRRGGSDVVVTNLSQIVP